MGLRHITPPLSLAEACVPFQLTRALVEFLPPLRSSYRSPRPLSDILGQGQGLLIYFVLSQPTKLNRPTKNAPVRTPVKAFAVKFINTTDSGPIVKNSTGAVNKSSVLDKGGMPWRMIPPPTRNMAKVPMIDNPFMR